MKTREFYLNCAMMPFIASSHQSTAEMNFQLLQAITALAKNYCGISKALDTGGTGRFHSFQHGIKE